MSIEIRAGREYYYRKHRVEGRVVADYIGPISNPVKARIAIRDSLKIESKREQLAQFREEIAELATVDASLQELIDFNHLMVKATLIAAGYHSHKREWRKRRDA